MKEKYIIGIDEAGRGPLAGPLAVGGVCVKAPVNIKHEFFADGVRDSKKLTPLRREKLYAWMCEQKEITHTVAFAPAELIDAAGVTISINKALEGVLNKLLPNGCEPSEVEVLLDGGLKAPEHFSQQKTIVRGDETEVLIALASVVAKVVRDKRMKELAKEYPRYGFEKHKGYGTKAHYEAIEAHGMCAEHRRRFLRKYTSS